jgi:hypothetical protein
MADLASLEKLKEVRDAAQKTEAIGSGTQLDLLAHVTLLFIVAVLDQIIDEAKSRK